MRREIKYQTFTVEEVEAGLSTMSTKELQSYRNILRMPALRSEATKALNARDLEIVERLLSQRV